MGMVRWVSCLSHFIIYHGVTFCHLGMDLPPTSRPSSRGGVPVAGDQAAAGSTVDGSAPNFGDVLNRTLRVSGDGRVRLATSNLLVGGEAGGR